MTRSSPRLHERIVPDRVFQQSPLDPKPSTPQSPAQVNAYEIYKQLDPALVQEMFLFFREEERDLYKTTLASLAQNRKLRPVFVQKKSVPDQITWLHKTLQLRTNDIVGEHLFQVWFMKGQKPLLIDFCDGMGIEHDGEGSVEGELPETLDEEKLKTTVETLLGKYNPKLVALYLLIFNLQTPDGWNNLTALLKDDERISFS